ncbi:MAG: hypothetical protein COA78_19240 [Blastopirellula sp.]|nr:MAG: hypothetical protein COA78_19240 [Blastopirellula sp.]
MSIASGELWELQLAQGWEMEVDEYCTTLLHPEGVGALQISAFTHNDGSEVLKSDLLAETNLPEEKQRFLAELQWGDFSGYQLIYAQEEDFWRKLWLTDGSAFLFITYNCNRDYEKIESQTVNTMLSTLRSPSAD